MNIIFISAWIQIYINLAFLYISFTFFVSVQKFCKHCVRLFYKCSCEHCAKVFDIISSETIFALYHAWFLFYYGFQGFALPAIDRI